MKRKFFMVWFCFTVLTFWAQNPEADKPRILISTDIGGTDPDDNQSMTHLLMYSDLFKIEGLVSSPSYGNGSKEDILKMISIYEKDFPTFQQYKSDMAKPDYLRSITKQGQWGNAPYKGYTTTTQGSDWIVTCAKRKTSQPLWVLVWGGLEDLAQALHDAPEIHNRIKVYWIGGPNKKWSANSYAYIVKNFPDLWFIEVNSSYYGFFSDNSALDTINSSNYYEHHIDGAGHLGREFKSYYNGEIKMGDTPSLLYLMKGNPDDPTGESWGGSFTTLKRSPRIVYSGTTTMKDTVAFCSVLEFHFKGPKYNIPADSICFWMEVPYGKSAQKWPGYYLGNGNYAIRYIPKKAETLKYNFSSQIPEIDGQHGTIVVDNLWPGKEHSTDYKLGNNWFTDRSEKNLYDGKIQGGKTILEWRDEVLTDWAKRWDWLKKKE